MMADDASSPLVLETSESRSGIGLEVICLGFPRTGTSSLRKALELLGYKFNPKSDASTEMKLSVWERDMWNRAIDAKIYGRGRRFGREEWDELFGVADGTTAVIADLPHLTFAAELISAYPDAKIILTTRETRKWWKSYSTTVELLLSPVPRFPAIFPWNRRSAVFQRKFNVKVLRATFGHPQPTPEQARKRFEKYYEAVRKLLPKIKAERRRLEYRVGEGWARLCAFLGKDEPMEEFPR
ncbi:hypothetical protein C8F01DRAFT_1023659, partial [Mycena amicta]